MSALVFKIQSTELTTFGVRARKALGAEGETQMADAGGRAVKLLLVNYFTELNLERVNKMGGERTNFYAAAARSVQNPQTSGGSAVIAINKVGLAQRLLGGTIRPIAPKKYLAIPARSEAYGKTPGDFLDLDFVPRGNGKAMLVQRLQTQIVYGKKLKNGQRDYSTNLIGGFVMFWLVTEVYQHADPTVLPQDAVMQQEAYNTMEQFLARRLASNN